MKKVLRSVLKVDGSLSDDELQENLFYLSDSDLSFLKSEDQAIWDFVERYAKSHSGQVPSINSVRDNFEREQRYDVLDRIENVASVDRVYYSSDFENLVKNKLESQYERRTGKLFQRANHILKEGFTPSQANDRYEGYRDALNYVVERADDLLAAGRGEVRRSDITGDTDEMRSEFENTINNLRESWGIGTGLETIDSCCRGINPGELWLHAGFTSDLKTTFALNWAYKCCMIFGWNVYYVSLEMPVQQIRRIFYVMHSSHPRFEQQGYEPLDYRFIRDGVTEDNERISQEDIDFFHKVVDDVEQNRGRDYGRFIVEAPKKENATIPAIQNRMEMIHHSTPIHLAFIDYFGLVQPHRNMGDYYQELNMIINEAKQMCLNFARGEKLPLVALHQINREGRKEAERNDGHYTKRALADANAAERTSDVITYTYLNDRLRDNNEVRIGNLKNRDNPMFDQFIARVDPRNRFIRELVEDNEEDTGFDLID